MNQKSSALLAMLLIGAMGSTLPAASQALPPCYLAAVGSHTFPITDAEVTIIVTGVGVDTVVLSGPTEVVASPPPDPDWDADNDGRIELITEIVAMKLQGTSDLFGIVTVTESTALRSMGMVEQKVAGGSCFPADSFFDVFVEATATGPNLQGIAHNDDPVRMAATIKSIPPKGDSYLESSLSSVDLFSGPSHLPPAPPIHDDIGDIIHAQHAPIPERPLFSVAPGNSAGLDPADLHFIAQAGVPGVAVPKALLGLASGDDIDALSLASADGTFHDLRFSVESTSQGLLGTGVRDEATKTPAQASGDEFSTVGNGMNNLFMDEAIFGLASLDELDAMAGDGFQHAFAPFPVYFSLAAGSPTLASIGATPGDVLVSFGNGLPPTIDADYTSLGLTSSDDVDALCGYPAVGRPTLFSLTSASPTITGLGASGADLLTPSAPMVVADAAALGLEDTDDLDAVKCGQGPMGGGGAPGGIGSSWYCPVVLLCIRQAEASGPSSIASRTFTDSFSVSLDFNEGAGIFDPTPGTGVGDQTCAALLSADAGASLLLLFYLNGRVVVEGGPGLGTGVVPNTVVAADVTECAGFTPGFQGDVGTDQVDNDNIGGYIVIAPLPSNTVFPGSESTVMDLCETGDGSTTVTYSATVGDWVAACVGTYSAGVHSGLGSAANWDTSFYANGAYTGTNGGIVSVCVQASIFDLSTLAFETRSDEDYFALVDDSDAPDGILNTLTQHTPDVWSAINANGC